MVAGQNRDVPEVLRILIPVEILVEEAVDIAAGIFLEVAVVFSIAVAVDTAAVIVVVTHQRRVSAALFVEHEVHVVTCAQRQRRIAPLSDHGRIREFKVKHAAHVSPDRAGAALLVIVVFDQRRGHVYAETVAAVGEPEAHDVFEGFAGRDRGRVAEALLPGLCHFQETVVQRGLALEEVQNIAPAPLALPTDVRQPGSTVKAKICPDEAVGILVFLCLLALAEPGVLFGSVSGYQIEQYADPFLVCLLKEVIQIFIGPVARRHFFVIADVVSGVFKRRVKAGIDPERIAPQALNVIQFRGDPVYVSDPVPVRVIERLGIDLIKYCVF